MFNTRSGLVVRVRLELVVVGRCCWVPAGEASPKTLQNMIEQFLWTFIVYGVGGHTVVCYGVPRMVPIAFRRSALDATSNSFVTLATLTSCLD